MGQSAEAFGRADVRDLVVVTAFRMVGERPIDVLTHVQIGVAIAIKVAERSARCPGESPVESRGVSHVLKAPALFGVVRIDRDVPEEGNASPTRHEEVGPPVAVVVRDGRAVGVEPGLSVGEGIQARCGCDVLELSVAEVSDNLRDSHDFFASGPSHRSRRRREEDISRRHHRNRSNPRHRRAFEDRQVIGFAVR